MKKQPTSIDSSIRRLQIALSAKAIYEGPEKSVHTRYAEQDGSIYIDLARNDGKQVKITAHNFETLDGTASPIKFIQKPGMLPMPIPRKGMSIDVLKTILRLDEDDWVMLVAWMLAVMKPTGPFPFLILQGPKGSTKTTTATMLKTLLDPSTVPSQSLSKSERDLIIAANNSWVLNFDNMEGIKPAMADAFCRLSTGGGLRMRQLYKNSQETLFSIRRPIIMNSITDISTRGDFLDRSIVINLAAPNGNRITEGDLRNAFNDCRPDLFGYLCESISCALANYQSMDIPNLPRMADLATLVTAAEPALGWKRGTFLDVYEKKRNYQTEITLEDDPVALSVMDLMAASVADEWAGKPRELLNELVAWTDDHTARSKKWPKGANVLSGMLRRNAPSLREKGIEIEWSKSGSRKISIKRISRDDDPDRGRSNDNVEAKAWESGTIE